MSTAFFIESLLLGIGLEMSKKQMYLIAATFGGFQAGMPMIGWFCVHVIAEAFETFHKMTPVIALVLLLYIGGKMLISGIQGNSEEEKPAVGFKDLMVQGIATAIDASMSH